MTRITLIIIAALVICSAAVAGNPRRPQCAPPARPNCKIHYVSYSYIDRAHDNLGNHYWRVCHVPAHHKRWCGPWHIK